MPIMIPKKKIPTTRKMDLLFIGKFPFDFSYDFPFNFSMFAKPKPFSVRKNCIFL